MVGDTVVKRVSGVEKADVRRMKREGQEGGW
jgi:hypothetical protein